MAKPVVYCFAFQRPTFQIFFLINFVVNQNFLDGKNGIRLLAFFAISTDLRKL